MTILKQAKIPTNRIQRRLPSTQMKLLPIIVTKKNQKTTKTVNTVT